MTKGEKLYYSIQEEGIYRVEKIAAAILKEIDMHFGLPKLDNNINSIDKLYILIQNGYYPFIEELLERNGYNFRVELQLLIKNFMFNDKTQGDPHNNPFNQFQSIRGVGFENGIYTLNTRVGLVRAQPLNRVSFDKKIHKYSLIQNYEKYCHEAVLNFIRTNQEYKAVTSIVPSQFGEEQYHSYIELENGFVDFARNAYLLKDDFFKIFIPRVISQVYGYELEEKESLLDETDLPKDKHLLARIAVHEQIKRVK